jgi:hypothetical protein
MVPSGRWLNRPELKCISDRTRMESNNPTRCSDREHVHTRRAECTSRRILVCWYTSTGVGLGVQLRPLWVRATATNMHIALIPHHRSLQCLHVLSYFRRLDVKNTQGQTNFEVKSNFHSPTPRDPNANLPHLGTVNQGDCGRLINIESQVRRYIFEQLKQIS